MINYDAVGRTRSEYTSWMINSGHRDRTDEWTIDRRSVARSAEVSRGINLVDRPWPSSQTVCAHTVYTYTDRGRKINVKMLTGIILYICVCTHATHDASIHEIVCKCVWFPSPQKAYAYRREDNVYWHFLMWRPNHSRLLYVDVFDDWFFKPTREFIYDELYG